MRALRDQVFQRTGFARRRPVRLAFVGYRWQCPPDMEISDWTTDQVAREETHKWHAYVNNCSGAGPLGFSHESHDPGQTRSVSFHNLHVSFLLALALAARGRDRVSVLDWGGSLGHYGLLGRTVFPGLNLDYNVCEVPAMARAGADLNPAVTFFTDDNCLEQQYDLVVLSGVLQCVADWQTLFARLSPCVGDLFLLTRVPVVQTVPSFVAKLDHYGAHFLHWQFNQAELLSEAANAGLFPIRELVVGDRLQITNAPEIPEMRGWLLRRGAT